MDKWLLITVGVNFILAMGYLVRRSGRYDFPFWLYVAAALFFWWPVTVYPLLFLAERGFESDKQTASYKIRLSWMVWAFTVAMQAALSFVLPRMLYQVDKMFSHDAVQMCIAAATLALSVVLIVAVHYLEKVARRNGA